MSDGEDVNITKRIINKVSFIYAFFSDAFWREKNTVSKFKERVFASRREDDTDTIFTRKYNNNNKWYQK